MILGWVLPVAIRLGTLNGFYTQGSKWGTNIPGLYKRLVHHAPIERNILQTRAWATPPNNGLGWARQNN